MTKKSRLEQKQIFNSEMDLINGKTDKALKAIHCNALKTTKANSPPLLRNV